MTQRTAITNDKYDEIIRAVRSEHGPFYASKQEIETILLHGAKKSNAAQS